MAYINGKQVNFSSYILDENGYYTKNEIKDQINFAESERQKSLGTDGAIIHKKDIADVEHIETIYDRLDATKDWGYTSGIPAGTTVTGLDLTKYKRLKVMCSWVEGDSQTGHFEIDLTTKPFSTSNGYEGSVVFDGDIDSDNNNQLFVRTCRCRVNDDKNSFTCIGAGLRENGGYSHNYIRPLKIMGVF